jgi:hypothetical protein
VLQGLKSHKPRAEFEKNHPQQLREFLTKLNELVDDYNHNIYLIDCISKGLKTIEIAISDELNRDK